MHRLDWGHGEADQRAKRRELQPQQTEADNLPGNFWTPFATRVEPLSLRPSAHRWGSHPCRPKLPGRHHLAVTLGFDLLMQPCPDAIVEARIHSQGIPA